MSALWAKAWCKRCKDFKNWDARGCQGCRARGSFTRVLIIILLCLLVFVYELWTRF